MGCSILFFCPTSTPPRECCLPFCGPTTMTSPNRALEKAREALGHPHGPRRADMTCGHQLRLSSLSSDSMRRTWGTPFASNVSKMRRTARGSMKRIAENGSEGSDGTAGRGNEQLGMLKHGTEGSEEPMQKSVLILRGLTSRVYAGLDKCKGQECLEVRPLWNMTKGYLIKSLAAD